MAAGKDVRTREVLLVGGGVLGGTLLGVAAFRYMTPVRVRNTGSSAPVYVPPTTGSGTTTTQVPGVEVLTPASVSPLSVSAPATSTAAPTVTDLVATNLTNGLTTLTWAGTLVSSWVQSDGTRADNVGYDLYQKVSGGNWRLLEPEVYPPLTLEGISHGAVLGVAPVYALPSGALIAGGIISVTVG